MEYDYPEGEVEEIAYQETGDGEIEAFADFLRLLDEHYCSSTSRYSAKRIYICVEHGDKHVNSFSLDDTKL